MDNQKPHDSFFKQTFGKVDVAKSFLEHYLPEDVLVTVDIDSLEPQKDSFVRGDLTESFSDLLFRATIADRLGYVYFLFEHKSYRSIKVALQLLTYMVEIWKRSNEDQLPLIIPMVIAHGRSRWNTSSQFAELMQGYDQFDTKVKQYVPNFEYILFDLSTYSNDDMKGNVQLRILMEVFRDIFKANTAEFLETLERSILALQELEDKDTRTAYFQTLINYIFNVKKNFSQNEVKKFSKRIEHIYPEGSKMIMSLREEILQEGKQEGKLEGRLLQNQEDIRYFLEENISEEAEDLYKKVTSIQDVERLGELKRKLYRMSSKSEIKKVIKEGVQ